MSCLNSDSCAYRRETVLKSGVFVLFLFWSAKPFLDDDLGRKKLHQTKLLAAEVKNSGCMVAEEDCSVEHKNYCRSIVFEKQRLQIRSERVLTQYECNTDAQDALCLPIRAAAARRCCNGNPALELTGNAHR